MTEDTIASAVRLCKGCGKTLVGLQRIWCARRCRVLFSHPLKAKRYCTVEGCGKKHAGHGYCSKHLKRLRTHGDIDTQNIPRTCVVCNTAFTPSKHQPHAVYCCKQCRQSHSYEKRKQIVCENAIEKQCVWCGQGFFEDGVTGKVCCSRSCAGQLAVTKRITLVCCESCMQEYSTPHPSVPVCPGCARQRMIRRVVVRNARRKALRRGAIGPTHTEKDWQRLLGRHQGLCAYCHEQPAVHRDHVIPIKRGGSDSIGNILPACVQCNLTKGSMLLIEWLHKDKKRKLYARA